MTEQEFKDYTKQITLRVVKLVEDLPKHQRAQLIGNQLLRAAAAIGASYRAACRARSSENLISRLTEVGHQTDQSLFWLEIMADARLISQDKFAELNSDLEEIVVMTTMAIEKLRPK